MMDLYQHAKEEVKRAADIVEVIGQFVQLKRAGQSYVGLCPFHSEKAPSFNVNPARQIFHCFGCKKGGDVFAFWMEYHKITFPQALRNLAERYNIDLPEKPLTPFQKEKRSVKEKLFELNEKAADFFHHALLKTKEGEPGRRYFEVRGIPDDLIEEFRLGYAPNQWNGLCRHLESGTETMETAVQAGLIIPKKSGGYYDRFRGRVVFPIFNLTNQVIGFGARVLDDALPKYLNTPETPLFHKAKTLYGLHAAFQAIRESNRAVIVEGYTDVLALRKHGFFGSVATLGTALTRDHVRVLKGYSEEAVVVFDADSAGKSAAVRSLSCFLSEGLSSSVLILPEGDDPDTFVNKKGRDQFLDLLDRAVPMFDFFMDLKLSRGGNQIEQQVNDLEEIFKILAELDNETQRALYIKRLAEKSGISETIAASEVKKMGTSPGREGAGSARNFQNSQEPVERPEQLENLDDHYILNLMIHHPNTIAHLLKSDCGILLTNPLVKEIFDVTARLFREKQEISSAEIQKGLSGEEAKSVYRETELSPSIFPENMVEQALKGFQQKVIKLKIAQVRNRAGGKTDLTQLNQILAAKRSIEGQIV